LNLRKKYGVRVRQPLATLTVTGAISNGLAEFTDLIADEVNVKKVVLSATDNTSAELTVNPRALGPRLGADVQRVIRAVKAGDWSATVGGVTAGGIALQDGEFELRQATADDAIAVEGGSVRLDTALTDELEIEGRARDLVRAVQNARRDAGLAVTDRIRLRIGGDAATRKAAEKHRDLIAGETLAVDVETHPADATVISVVPTKGE
jgi:isoleucyl-tRNA synthetase